MTKALAKELGPSNIQVNCIAPGVIQTDMLNDIDEEIIEGLREETPLMRIGTVDDIANCALFLASDKSDFITGQVISPNGGFVIKNSLRLSDVSANHLKMLFIHKKMVMNYHLFIFIVILYL